MLSSVVHRVIALVTALLVAVWAVGSSPLMARDEVRALWVVRTTLTSPSEIATMVASAKSNGFNTLLVQIRGRGDAYYQGGIEPRPAALDGQASFDPLATVIARAHESGLRVHAWLKIGRAH